MKNKSYLAVLLLSIIFLVQGEATGQISIGVPEATTTVITVSTIAAVQQPLNIEWIIAIVIVAVVYAVKKWL